MYGKSLAHQVMLCLGDPYGGILHLQYNVEQIVINLYVLWFLYI